MLPANSRVAKKIMLKMKEAVREIDSFRKKGERRTNCGEFISFVSVQIIMGSRCKLLDSNEIGPGSFTQRIKDYE